MTIPSESTPEPRKVDRRFIIDRQGKPFVLMAGLLDLAHQDGLDLIETHQTQVASDDNGMIHIFRAIAHTQRGTFTGHGSAGPANVSRIMLTHTLELAETRAIGRALRFATNIGMTTFEELGDDAIGSDLDEDRSVSKGGLPSEPPPRSEPVRPPPPIPDRRPDNVNLVTPAQVRAIYAIAKDKHGFSESQIEEQCTALFGVRPSELSRRQASDFITNIQGRASA